MGKQRSPYSYAPEGLETLQNSKNWKTLWGEGIGRSVFSDGRRRNPSGKFDVSVVAHRRKTLEERKDPAENEQENRQLEDR